MMGGVSRRSLRLGMASGAAILAPFPAGQADALIEPVLEPVRRLPGRRGASPGRTERADHGMAEREG